MSHHAGGAGISHIAPIHTIQAGRYRTRRARGWKLWLMLAILLPVMFAVVSGIYLRERTIAWQNFNIRQQELARLTAQAIDARLSAVTVAARVLSLSPLLRPGPTDPAWQEQARLATAALGGWVVLCQMDTPPARLFDTLHRPGTPFPPFSDAARAEVARTHAAALASDQPAVSDQFISPLTGTAVVMVAVATPTRPGDDRRLIVDYVIEAAGLAGLLTPQHLGEQAQVTIRDGNDRIIATTHAHPQDTAAHAARWQDPAHQRSEGLFQDVAATGMTSLYAYQRPEAAPRWRVVVVAPLLARALLVGGPLWAPMLMAAVLPALLLLTLGTVVRMRHANRTALDQLDRILAKVPAAIFVDLVHPDGRRERRFISHSARQLRDGNWVDLPDDPVQLARVLTPANAEAFAEFRAEVRLRGRGDIEFTVPGEGGRRHDFRTAEICFERRPDGSLLVVGCVTDITAANAARQRLQQAEKLAVLGEVAAGIAHEMNQPLAAIAMAAQNGVRALTREPANPARARAKFTLIHTQVARISAVVNHISLFGRAGISAAAPFAVAGVLANALRLAEPRLAEQNISVRQEIDPALPTVFGVDIMLEQVLLNILINAAEAYQTHTDAQARTLLVRAHLVGPQRLLISIADHAGGIEAATAARVFEPFFSTKPDGAGAGLGLSISFATVAEMGGELRVRNQAGGAVFEIELPVPAADARTAPGGTGWPRQVSA